MTAMTELKGYGSRIDWDGEKLTISGRGAATLARSDVAGVELTPPRMMTNGSLTIHANDGNSYKVNFLKKHQAEFEQLAGEFSTIDAAEHSTGSFAGVRLGGGQVHYQGKSYPLPATARVETAGQIQERVTATRLLATGIFAFALKKKKDARELYLTVEGDGWGFVVDVDPNKGAQARQFAMAVTNAR